MWVKICANTNLNDALAAIDLGADALGFVFAPSPRQVTAAQVGLIVEALPAGVERVGVFGEGAAEDIAAAAREAHLTAVQLHGGISASGLTLSRQLGHLMGSGISIIQTVHWPVGDDVVQDEVAERVAAQLTAVAAAGFGDRVLVDAKVGAVSGGTGRTFNWEVAKLVLHSQKDLKIVVAGGLRPENVAEAVHALDPWGVDVASGVEREPGFKDRAKLQRFIKNARGE
jgi:phosphoribosylanthranilate isomerase